LSLANASHAVMAAVAVITEMAAAAGSPLAA
jgi:hypothetical protein